MEARAGRLMLTATAVIGSLLAVAAAALWVWAGSAHSLHWSWSWLAPRWHLQAQGLEGSLREGLRAHGLRWEGPAATVDAEGVEIRWSLSALAGRRVDLTLVRADAVRITRTPDGREAAPVPPPSLALPAPVAIGQLVIGRLHFTSNRSGATSDLGTLADVEGRYDYTPGAPGHRLQVSAARWSHPRLGQAHWRGQAILAEQWPARVEATVSGDYQPPQGAWSRLVFDASASGLATDLPLRITLRPRLADASARVAGTAVLSLRLTPGRVRVWQTVDARLDAVDLATLWPGAPRTALEGHARLTAPGPQGPPAGPLALTLRLRNRSDGPWDTGRLPVTVLNATLERVNGEWTVPRLQAEVGDGRIDGSGQWRDARRWSWRAEVQGLSGARLHGRLAEQPLAGTLRMATQAAGVGLSIDLREAERRATDASRPALRSVRAQGIWIGQEVQLPQLRIEVTPAVIDGTLVLWPARGAGRGRLHLMAPGVSLQAEGQLSPDAGDGRAQLKVHAVGSAARAWRQVMAAWGAAPAPEPSRTGILPAWVAGAALDATLEWSGGWRGPIQGRVLSAQARQDAWHLRLQAPLAWQWTPGRTLALAAGLAVLQPPAQVGPAPAHLQWEGLRWAPGTLETRGRLTGLPMTWLGLASRAPLRGDLVFDGSWDLSLARELRLRATLARTSGDLSVLAETADGLPARVAAGVRRAEVALEGQDGALSLALRWDSQRAGTVAGELRTRLQPGGATGWHWPRGAPIAGGLAARLPRLAVWSLLAPAGWRLRGTLEADLALAGTRDQPRWSGTLRADGLGLRSVVDGIALQDGQLRARLEDRELRIDSLTFSGGSGAGRLQADGVGRWLAGDRRWELQMQAQLDRLPASLLPERQVTLSGQAQAHVTPGAATLRANLRMDSARIVLADPPAPRLGPDVVVRGAPGSGFPGSTERQGPAAGSTVTRRPVPASLAAPGQGMRSGSGTLPAIDLQARIDLGQDFQIRGRGLSARARGVVDVTGMGAVSAPEDLRLAGAVDIAGGTYLAFGQRLALERGLLRFNGPAMDPALDLLAVRRTAGNPQRVGVQVSGRAQTPRISLWSEPSLTQAETLSWLALGRPAAAGAGETAVLEDLALSLLLRRAGLGAGAAPGPSGPTGAISGLAARLGLDELGLRRGSAPGGQVGASLALGKRIAGNVYAVYEHGLAGALGTLRVFYDISRRLQLRLEAGDRSGADLVYTVSID